MSKPKIYSIRGYSIKVFTGIKQSGEYLASLDNIVGLIPHEDLQDTELQYTLQEDIDYILDLKIGDNIILNQSRDGDLKDKCLITRIS